MNIEDFVKQGQAAQKAVDAITSEFDQSHIAPEYRELHRWLVRALEIREHLLNHGGDALRGPGVAIVLKKLADLQNSITNLMILLQGPIQASNPALVEVWREASPK